MKDKIIEMVGCAGILVAFGFYFVLFEYIRERYEYIMLLLWRIWLLVALPALLLYVCIYLVNRWRNRRKRKVIEEWWRTK